jgi:hypothetical protein
MDSDKIWIVTSESVVAPESESPATPKGWGEEVQQQVNQFRDRPLDAADLERKMSRFLQTVGRLFRQAETQAQQQSGQAQMKLEEIELSIEISAEGEIKLVAASGKAAGKGAIKLKFKRSE